MKKIVSVLVTAVMLLGTLSGAWAGELFDDTVTESTGTVRLSVERAADLDNGISLCGMYFSYGRSTILNKGNYFVGATGTTYATGYNCDFLSSKCMIEQFRNGVWMQYDSHTETAVREPSVTMSYSEPVPSGHYYRVRTVHCVRHNGDTESGISKTGAIWIGK